MRILYLLTLIYAALILSGCAHTPTHPAVEVSTETTTVTPPACHHHKNPQQVSLVTHSKLQRQYQVIGKVSVSKWNVVGIKRQEATIRDIMRQMAASMDGDALIDIKSENDSISGTIIAYKPALA